MKNIYVLLACVAGGFLAVSCSDSKENDVIDNTPKEQYFIVSAPSTNGTRATVVGDLNDPDPEKTDWTVKWEETDKIYAWATNSSEQSTFKYSKLRSKVNSAYFVLESGSFDPDANGWILMYPNVPNTTINDGIISTHIPSYQKARDNSFDPNAAIWTGKTSAEGTRDVELLPACTFFKITTTKPCYSVKVTANPETMAANQDLAWYFTGDVFLNTNSGASLISYTGATNPCEFVMLTKNGTADTSEPFEPGTYLMAVACSTRFPGLVITVDYGGGDKPTVSNPKKMQLDAGYFYNLGTANSTQGN